MDMNNNFRLFRIDGKGKRGEGERGEGESGRAVYKKSACRYRRFPLIISKK
jgi:hypothetical protein